MNTPQEQSPIPTSYSEAYLRFQKALKHRNKLNLLPQHTFLCGWNALFYIAPGLHPDESDNPDGGWPVGWRCFAEEAFRRAFIGELSDEELYPCEAQHAALTAARNAA